MEQSMFFLAGITQGIGQGAYILIIFGCLAAIGAGIWGALSYIHHKDMMTVSTVVVAIIVAACAFILVTHIFAAMTGAPINITPTAID